MEKSSWRDSQKKVRKANVVDDFFMDEYLFALQTHQAVVAHDRKSSYKSNAPTHITTPELLAIRWELLANAPVSGQHSTYRP